ncbi:aldehyde dehydrogenase [Saccharopolyspora indica]|uniref:aldehyde dehydrogenase n=1 Tax=Saccharopolyspora indica TaxID=1229659 RepID=UPI0022EB1B5D|nr:aldehyde dehydrogenase [Saccharopolyspora indica]MDA3644254.1 aldehyde dehydrogenase [Saccharopolyspora indica]
MGRNQESFYIGGRWVRPMSDSTAELISPVTEEAYARVPLAAKPDVDAAVSAARAAFDDGPWPRMPLAERIDALRRFADVYRPRHGELAELVTREMGAPITLSKRMHASVPQLILDAFLELAPQYPFRTVRRSSTGNALVTREPVGVVAAIIPWNTPHSTAMLKIVPALLAGCTVVLKPAEETPLDAVLLAECIDAAGLPDGVLNVVTADRQMSEQLVVHPGVDKVAFTGSTAAGRRIASLCGNDLRRVTLELGGKSAAVVLDDADLDAVMAAVGATSMRNSGQACSNKTRIIVSRRREADLLERLTEHVASLKVGDPGDPDTDIGPLVSARQRERVERYVAAGRAEGAKLVAGGGRPAGLARGWFVEPTVFTDVRPSMTIAQEEIFGPVLSVLTCADEDEAVTIANDSCYGLNGSVFSTDLGRGLAVASRIRTGTVELNGHPVGFHAPIGGFKRSGIGREAGLEGFDSYVELRSIGLPGDLAEALA